MYVIVNSVKFIYRYILYVYLNKRLIINYQNYQYYLYNTYITCIYENFKFII